MTVIASKKVFSPKRSIATSSFCLIQLDTCKIPKSKFLNLPNVFDRSSGAILKLASLSDVKSVGDAFQVILITDFWLPCGRMSLWIFGKEGIFPLSEISV